MPAFWEKYLPGMEVFISPHPAAIWRHPPEEQLLILGGMDAVAKAMGIGQWRVRLVNWSNEHKKQYVQTLFGGLLSVIFQFPISVTLFPKNELLANKHH